MSAYAMMAAAMLAAQQTPVVERSSEAVAIVREAAEALGGFDRLLEAEGLTFAFEGEAYFPYQGPTPDEPGVFNYTEGTAVAYSSRAMQVTSGFTGGETAFTRTVDVDGTDLAAQAEFARQLRQSPHAVIREWIASPRDLVLADRTRREWIVSGAFYGKLTHAYIDRETRLVSRIEVPFDDPRSGDAAAIAEFSGYYDEEGWRYPSRIRVVEAGNVIFDLPYQHYSVGAPSIVAQEPAEIESDAPSQADEASTPPERPSAETFLHRDYGEGVRALFNTGGPDYHSLAVATDEGVIVIEAPGTLANGTALVERASALGPVRFIASTHHHDDHAGGAAGAAGEGRRYVVAEGQRAFFEDMVSAQRSFLPFRFEPHENQQFISVPEGGEVDIAGRVIAYDAGPSGHSNAHLVFYVPEARLLFQTDMAVFRWDGGVEAAREQTCRLRAFIEEQDLEIDVIVGGHGRAGTLDDLDAAVAAREAGC